MNRNFIKLKIRDGFDYRVIKQIFSDNDYGIEKLARCSEIQAWYQKIINDGKEPLIIDCGGNSGMATRFFSETYHMAKIVYIEPVMDNYQMAIINNQQNPKLEFINSAIGSRVAKADINDPGQGNWGFRVEENETGSVEIISVDSILEKVELSNAVPFIIKIDIEGFEENLFSENVDWIDRFPLMIIELHDWMLPRKANSKNFLIQISKRNRDFVFFAENVFSISNDSLY